MPPENKSHFESDAELLQGGSGEDFEVLYSRYNQRLIGSAFRLLGGRPCAREIAEEILQVCWVRIKNRQHLYDRKTAMFATWAYSIVKNEVIDHFRRKKNQTTAPIDKIDEDKLGVGARDSFWLDEFRSDFADCLQRLSNDERLVVTSVLIDGEEQKDVGESLKISEPTVSRRKKKALDSLRNCLQSKDWTGNEFVEPT